MGNVCTGKGKGISNEKVNFKIDIIDKLVFRDVLH